MLVYESVECQECLFQQEIGWLMNAERIAKRHCADTGHEVAVVSKGASATHTTYFRHAVDADIKQRGEKG